MNKVIIFGLILIFLSANLKAQEVVKIDSVIFKSELVFVAKILNQNSNQGKNTYHLEIREKLKGKLAEIETLITDNEPEFNQNFQKDSVYLIYGRKDGNFIKIDCESRTTKLNKAIEIDYLRYTLQKEEYDTLNLTKNELNAFRNLIIPTQYDYKFTKQTDIFYYNGLFISKKQLISFDPKTATFEYRIISSGDRKLVDYPNRDRARNGALIIYDGKNPKIKKRYKFLDDINQAQRAIMHKQNAAN